MSERAQHYRTVGKDDLTARQREVLQLIAAGKTNPEIAERLGITLDGAKFHVREILAKLDVESREEAADWWRAQRGIGSRVASWARGLSPAAWFKPAAIGTAVGGTTLGLVAVGFAMNGGGGAETAASLPACELLNLKPTARTAQSADGEKRFELLLSAKRDCRFTGRGWVRVVPPDPNRGMVTSPISEGVYLDLSADERVVATALWRNYCPELQPGTLVQFDLSRLEDIAAGQPISTAATVDDVAPPPCRDPQRASELGLVFETDDPAQPACEPLALGWTHEFALDPAAGSRFTWSAESATRCILDETVTVAVQGPGGAAMLTPLNIEGSPAEIAIAQELGVGSTTVVSGLLTNVCGQSTLAMSLVVDSGAYMVPAVPVPPCTDPTKPASLTAIWSAMISSKPVVLEPFEFSTEPGRMYTVKAGDTLMRIAMEFGTTPARILLMNPGLDATKLRIGQEIQIPAPRPTPTPAGHVILCDARDPACPPPTATPTIAGRTMFCDIRTGNCPIPLTLPCGFPGCLVSKEILADVDGFLAGAVGMEMAPGEPAALHWYKSGTRKTISPEQFRIQAGDYLRLSPTLVAVGDPQKNGVLDLLFLTGDGRAFAIAIEPVADGYAPIGITFWDELLPADGAAAETSFGTAVYRLVPVR